MTSVRMLVISLALLMTLPLGLAGTFSHNEDFSDPAVLGSAWVPAVGSWSIIEGALRNTAPGCCPIYSVIHYRVDTLERPLAVEFDLSFMQDPGGGVGRHGGVVLAHAWVAQPAATGYSVDWIDRESDRGFRVTDNAVAIIGHADGPAPETGAPQRWRLVLNDTHLSFHVDGAPLVSIEDSTHVMPLYLGFWAYSGNVVRIDDVRLASNDREAPALDILAPQAGAAYLGDEPLAATGADAPAVVVGPTMVSFTASDLSSGIAQVRVYVDDELLCTANGDGACAWDAGGEGASERIIRVEAEDLVGNHAHVERTVLLVRTPA